MKNFGTIYYKDFFVQNTEVIYTKKPDQHPEEDFQIKVIIIEK